MATSPLKTPEPPPPPPDVPATPDLTKDACDKGRDDAFETLNKDQAEYDKQLLALSAGFLGVSLAFVKDVVPLKDAAHLWEFYAALGLLFGCVCFVLATFQYGIHAHLGLADYWKRMGEMCGEANEAKREETRSNLERRHAKLERKHEVIKWLNWIAGGLFGVGVLFLVLFVILNVHRESYLSRTASATDSYNPSVQHSQKSRADVLGDEHGRR